MPKVVIKSRRDKTKQKGIQKEGEERSERRVDQPSVLEQAVSKFQIFPEECSASEDDQDLGRH
jgi:hypothetical protein